EYDRGTRLHLSGKKSPKTKRQTPEKFQTPNREQLTVRSEPESWRLFGAWDLVIGASAVRQCGIPSSAAHSPKAPGGLSGSSGRGREIGPTCRNPISRWARSSS